MIPPKLTTRTLWLSGLTILLIVAIVLVYQAMGRQALSELETQAQNRLTLFVANLDGILARYDRLPKLISENRHLVTALEQLHDDASVQTNRYLQQVAAIVGASDVYLMTTDGQTIAASNWDKPRSFVGQNFAFRPYFQQALSGQTGRYFALGTTSLKRGYYFSHPVRRSNDIIGVIVVKIELAELETAWSSEGNDFVVTDEDGVIFLSTRPGWTYQSLSPLSVEKREQIRAGMRYVGIEIGSLDLARIDDPERDIRRVSLSSGNRDSARHYLHLAQAMPQAGWIVHMFANTANARESQRLRTAVSGFSLLVVMLLIILYLANRQRRLALQNSTELLETRVQQRTLELQTEVEERRKAEQSLRDTQSELIQTAKMAGLGQMSAGISHELNQPLTAIRNYAENTRRMLERNEQAAAQSNLVEIGEIIDHMATIISQLRGFSRKSSGDKVRLSIGDAIAQALRLFQREIDAQQIQVVTEIGEAVSLQTDPLLLNQVLVNLLNNAIQAMQDQPTRAITITVSQQESSIAICIDDTGPGIDAKVIENIFDPFFTTKEVGLGLGLGLSISYRIMDSLGGRIEVGDNPAGGARFRLYLPHE